MTTAPDEASRPPGQRRPAVVLLVFVVFFVVSLFTNILGPLIPEIISAFHLSLTAAGLLPFAFFAAYGLSSIPAGIWIEHSSAKRVLVASFVLALASALAFAVFPAYGIAIGSLFAMGVAMAAVQVAVNPLLRVAGGEEHFAFYSTLAQLIFGSASFVSPRIYSALVGQGRSWVSVYWIFALLAAIMIAVVWVAPLPRAPRTEEERAGTLAAHVTLARGRVVPIYFISIFMYVGSEQGIANWMSQFLATYHQVDARTAGADAVSVFWGLMTVGCLIGLLLLKLFDSRRVLIVHSILAIGLLALALFGDGRIAVLAFPAIGLTLSVMWPIIMSLALNSVPSQHGTVSGILCTGIVGGAFVPLLVGRVGDRFGLRLGMSLLFVTLAWVFAIGLWAKPLVKNETGFSRQKAC